jgi:hypothetical protein
MKNGFDVFCGVCQINFEKEFQMELQQEFDFGYIYGCPECYNQVLIMKTGFKRENYLIESDYLKNGKKVLKK